MAIRMTRKEIYKTYGRMNVIIIQSEDIRAMFERDGYFAGLYGWNCDIFLGRHFAYTSGYRPFGTSWEGDLQSLVNTMIADGCKLK